MVEILRYVSTLLTSIGIAGADTDDFSKIEWLEMRMSRSWHPVISRLYRRRERTELLSRRIRYINASYHLHRPPC